MLKIHFKSGNLLNSKAAILVNPVNTVGVMGAGLAKKFKEKYPNNFKNYRQHCKTNPTHRKFKGFAFTEKGKVIYNLATKENYSDDSKLAYIRYGLVRLLFWLNSHPERDTLNSIAISPIGCGLGKLPQIQVLHLILYVLKNVDFDLNIELYNFDRVDKAVMKHMAKVYTLSPSPKRFTGVGSRETDEDGRDKIYKVTPVLCNRLAYLLSTGDAYKGADYFFWESAPTEMKERFGPPGRKYYSKNTIVVQPDSDNYRVAKQIASKNHPAWKYLEEFHRELHTRNVFQVLGEMLDTPSEFLICWTPDGAETKTSKKTGGTGTAIRIANMFGIPVFNLRNDDAIARLNEYLGIRSL